MASLNIRPKNGQTEEDSRHTCKQEKLGTRSSDGTMHRSYNTYGHLYGTQKDPTIRPLGEVATVSDCPTFRLSGLSDFSRFWAVTCCKRRHGPGVTFLKEIQTNSYQAEYTLRMVEAMMRESCQIREHACQEVCRGYPYNDTSRRPHLYKQPSARSLIFKYEVINHIKALALNLWPVFGTHLWLCNMHTTDSRYGPIKMLQRVSRYYEQAYGVDKPTNIPEYTFGEEGCPGQTGNVMELYFLKALIHLSGFSERCGTRWLEHLSKCYRHGKDRGALKSSDPKCFDITYLLPDSNENETLLAEVFINPVLISVMAVVAAFGSFAGSNDIGDEFQTYLSFRDLPALAINGGWITHGLRRKFEEGLGKIIDFTFALPTLSAPANVLRANIEIVDALRKAPYNIRDALDGVHERCSDLIIGLRGGTYARSNKKFVAVLSLYIEHCIDSITHLGSMAILAPLKESCPAANTKWLSSAFKASNLGHILIELHIENLSVELQVRQNSYPTAQPANESPMEGVAGFEAGAGGHNNELPEDTFFTTSSAAIPFLLKSYKLSDTSSSAAHSHNGEPVERGSDGANTLLERYGSKVMAAFRALPLALRCSGNEFGLFNIAGHPARWLSARASFFSNGLRPMVYGRKLIHKEVTGYLQKVEKALCLIIGGVSCVNAPILTISSDGRVHLCSREIYVPCVGVLGGRDVLASCEDETTPADSFGNTRTPNMPQPKKEQRKPLAVRRQESDYMGVGATDSRREGNDAVVSKSTRQPNDFIGLRSDYQKWRGAESSNLKIDVESRLNLGECYEELGRFNEGENSGASEARRNLLDRGGVGPTVQDESISEAALSTKERAGRNGISDGVSVVGYSSRGHMLARYEVLTRDNAGNLNSCDPDTCWYGDTIVGGCVPVYEYHNLSVVMHEPPGTLYEQGLSAARNLGVAVSSGETLKDPLPASLFSSILAHSAGAYENGKYVLGYNGSAEPPCRRANSFTDYTKLELIVKLRAFRKIEQANRVSNSAINQARYKGLSIVDICFARSPRSPHEARVQIAVIGWLAAGKRKQNNLAAKEDDEPRREKPECDWLERTYPALYANLRTWSISALSYAVRRCRREITRMDYRENGVWWYQRELRKVVGELKSRLRDEMLRTLWALDTIETQNNLTCGITNRKRVGHTIVIWLLCNAGVTTGTDSTHCLKPSAAATVGGYSIRCGQGCLLKYIGCAKPRPATKVRRQRQFGLEPG